MATFMVTSVNDTGPGSLREAIEKANVNVGADTIGFAIPGGGAQRIAPVAELPAITESVTIDGTTQGSSTTPLIVIDGTLAVSTASGLRLSKGESTLRGLSIGKFPQNGVVLESDNNKIEGSFIGIGPTGSRSASNQFDGILITGSGNTIGGATSAAANVISGNGRNGISIAGPTAARNLVIGNTVGLDGLKSTRVANANAGVRISNGANNNFIGSTLTAEQNFISGNTAFGVLIEGANSNSNVVRGNLIGNGPDAATNLGNGVGVTIRDGAKLNSIGTGTTGARNIIAGNIGSGVQIRGPGTSDNKIIANHIGVVGVGVQKLGNGEDGVLLDKSASNNLIISNVISGNTRAGVQVSGDGTDGNSIRSNSIGTATDTNIAISNNIGVSIASGAKNNLVGEVDSGNTISGNATTGVSLSGVGTENNVVRANRIGTTTNGMNAQGNLDGINISAGAKNNIIGGTTTAERNIINGNLRDGILLTDSTTTGNQIIGNNIGINSLSIASVITNARNGISVRAGANNNTIGTSLVSSLTRNVIATNQGAGISIEDVGSSATIINNLIGVSSGGGIIGNELGGISIGDGATAIIGGVNTKEGNFISGNKTAGILVSGNRTTNVTILGNSIGLDRAGGTTANHQGILVTGSNVTIGSGGPGRNVISGNSVYGINLTGAKHVTIKGNLVGTTTTGLQKRGNGEGIKILNSTNILIGGPTDLDRNVISGNQYDGFLIANFGNADLTDPQVRIENNFIGLGTDGTTIVPNKDGVQYSFANRSVAFVGNFVSGNTRMGLRAAKTFNQLIQGNKIGLKADGVTPAGNGSHGIFLSDESSKNRIGGFASDQKNLIANNGGDGILIGSDPAAGFLNFAGTGNTLNVNLIFANAGQSIDVGSNDGVTANDVDDLDVGPNNLQNASVLTSAVTGGGLILVNGHLDSLPAKYRFDFYVGNAPGQAQRFLGSLVRTLNTVDLDYALTQQANVQVGDYVMVVTTNEDTGDSSELSAAIQFS